MTFLQTLQSIPGLTHYYPLDSVSQANDVVGGLHGTNKGATFSSYGAKFNGAASIVLPDDASFSVATKGALSIVAFLTIADWHGKGASEYIHWMGKGMPNAHEWTFRHYVLGGTGEASARKGRASFYHFNADGGLGAGSFFQDTNCPTYERVITATCDLSKVSLAVNGLTRDTDPLSGYGIKPSNTTSPPMLGTRGDNTGFLIGTLRRVAFYDRVLTAAEIKKIYDARAQDEGSTAPVQPPIQSPTPQNDFLATGGNLLDQHNALVMALKAKGVL